MIVKDIFKPRSYQRAVRAARLEGKRHFVCLWHRRAGKDRNALGFTLEEMLKRQGVYFHVFPSQNQGRRDLWDNIIHEKVNGVERALKMTEMFPRELVAAKDESEMQITLINGSIYQVMGADSDEAVERLRGPNPIGIVFSEYAHGTKMEKASDTLLPVLAQNGGWEMYVYTPNGINQGETLFNMASKNPEWFCEKKTIDDTRCDAVGEDGGPVVRLSEIESLRVRGIREEFIQQEFYCSFTGFQHGTIYGDLMMKALKDGRITQVPYIVNLPVGTLHDLGQSDAMAVHFYQLPDPNRINFIDYWEDTQKSIKDVARMLREDKPYIYGRHALPWDGQSAMDYMVEMGFKNVTKVDKRTSSVQANIESLRRRWTQFYWDEAKCGLAIKHLQNYARKFDEEHRVFAAKPTHDEHSHCADALRTGEEAGFGPLMFQNDFGIPIKVESDFDPRMV